MNHTTRNAPFGTDDTPCMTVKIVGGKRVQIAVDSSKNQGNKTFSDILDVGPTGTPAILTQPDWEAYDTPTPKVTGVKQSDVTRKVSSYTSPNGDRSYSFKHGLPTVNPRVMLPPYTSKSTDPFMPNQANSSQVDANAETGSLATQIAQQLKDFSLQNLKDMYIDLTTFDRQLTGMVGEAQFSVVALRHDMPLKLSLLKLVFAKFIDVRDPSMINYEKILQYFSDCIADGQSSKYEKLCDVTQRSTSAPRNVVQTNSTADQTSKIGQYTLQQRDDEKLIELIHAQLATEEMLELNTLKKSLQELDLSGTDILATDTIQSECLRNHLPLPMSLILKLLRRAETSSGKTNWVRFMEPLVQANEIQRRNATKSVHRGDSRISAMTYPEKEPVVALESRNRSLKSQARPSVVSSWKQTLAERPAQSAYSRISDSRSEFGGYSGLPSPPSTTSTLERELSRLPEGWDERERYKEILSTPHKTNTYPDKVNKLEEMLRSYNPSSEDILAISDAERITKNFNLIYKLGLSERLIDDAVTRSVLPNDGTSAYDALSVTKLLALLSIDQGISS